MRRLGRAALLAVLALVAAVPARAGEGQKNVLLLYAAPRLLPALIALDETFRATLQANLPDQVYFYTEYLDPALFTPTGPVPELQGLLVHKYGQVKLDLVVAVESQALRLALLNRAELFPGVPIVFASVERAAVADLELDRDVTGVWLDMDWAATLEAALRLQPETRRAVVVAGTSAIDRILLGVAREQLAPYQGRIEIQYLTDRSVEEVMKEVAALSKGTVVVFAAFLRDATGQDLIPTEVVRRVASDAPVPVYGPSATFVGTGAVGGYGVNFEAQGARAAEIAVRVLHGERPAPVDADTKVYMFDWRQLRRWGIDDRRLPPGSVVRFRQASVMEQYGWYLAGGAGLFLIQSGLVVGLLVQRRQRRRAQRALAERLRFEALLGELSATFVRGVPQQVDRQIEQALLRIIGELDLDRASLAEVSGRGDPLRIRHSVVRPGIEPVRGVVESGAFPWMRARLIDGQDVRFSRLPDLPPEAAADRESAAALGARSVAAVPLKVGGAVIGALAFATVRAERDWPDELLQRLHLVAEIFANALARQRAEQLARESEGRFRSMREELAHTLRVATLGELASAMAHEVNQPLAAVLTNAQAARRLLEAGRAERGEVMEALADIADDARRASEIIRGLRAMLRKEGPVQMAVDVNGVFEKVVSLLQDDLERKRVMVWLSLSPARPSVLGDPVQLQQVALNVLVNACDALAAVDGTREVSVVTAQPEPGLVEICVRDTGIGVKETELERIFERFVTTKPEGLGMGLSISRSIVEAHGGRIWASGNADRGLTVHIELPCEKGTPGA